MKPQAAPPLYGYDAQELAARPDERVFVPDPGRPDLVDLLKGEELLAVCAPKLKWWPKYSSLLRGRDVTLLPSNRRAGKNLAKLAAKSLHAKARHVSILTLPGLPTNGTVGDWFKAGRDAKELLELALSVEECTPADEYAQPGPPRPTPAESAKSKKTQGEQTVLPPQATRLIELAADAELFHTPGGDPEPFATVPVGQHRETYAVRSRAFKRWLRGRYFKEYAGAPNSQALQDALGTLEAQAVYDGTEHPVFIRVAEHERAIYLDLGDAGWETVKITPSGWEVVSAAPVKFRRRNGMLVLPRPQTGGSLADLARFVNIEPGDLVLVESWLVAAMRPVGPYPILVLNGEQGTAKSTLCRVLRKLVDPNLAPVRAGPSNVRDLMICSNSGWIVALDNLSRVQPWLSDALCRLATGGGFGTRELYSDDEERLFDSMRPVMVNGISELATRSDLADRALVLSLPPISEAKRLTERNFWSAFEQARPRILGALLHAVATAMRNLPDVEPQHWPRMADFAEWSVAAESAFGVQPGTFMMAYTGNRAAANETTIEASAIGPTLLGLLDSGPSWQGTATDLLDELSKRADEATKNRRDWPKTPRRVSGALKRLAPNLRAVSVKIEHGRTTDRKRRRIIILERLAAGPSEPSESSERAEGSAEAGYCRTDADGARTDGPPGVGDRNVRRERQLGLSPDGVDGSDGANPPLSACTACGDTRFWRLGGGPITCGACHPPARPESVTWLDVPNEGNPVA